MLITYLALNYYLLYLLYLHIEVYVIYMVIRVGDGSFKYLFEKLGFHPSGIRDVLKCVCVRVHTSVHACVCVFKFRLVILF